MAAPIGYSSLPGTGKDPQKVKMSSVIPGTQTDYTDNSPASNNAVRANAYPEDFHERVHDMGHGMQILPPTLVKGDTINGTGLVVVTSARVGVEGFREEQSVTITGNADGGSFTLTYSGQTTGAIAFGADAAAVQAALVALSNIEIGDVVVTGDNPAFTVTFGGLLALTDVALITATSSLTLQAPTVTPGTTVQGTVEPAVNEVQTVDVALARGGTFTISYGGETTSALAYNASTAAVQVALLLLSSLTPDKVAVTGDPGAYILTFGGALAATDVAEVTASGVGLSGGVAPGVTTVEETAGVPAVLAQQTVAVTGTPPSGTWTLTWTGTTTTALVIAATAVSVADALNALAGFPQCTVSGADGGPYLVTFDTDGPRALFTAADTFPDGTFAADDYFWKITALGTTGETKGSNEVTADIPEHYTQVLSWDKVDYAIGYKVYRGTVTNTENRLVATLGDVVTYTDTGIAGTAVSVPVAGNAVGAVQGDGGF